MADAVAALFEVNDLDVVCTARELVVGEVYRGLTDPHFQESTAAFRVVRPATEAEYRACLDAYRRQRRHAVLLADAFLRRAIRLTKN